MHRKKLFNSSFWTNIARNESKVYFVVQTQINKKTIQNEIIAANVDHIPIKYQE
jgi:hypothetical protein